MNNRSIMRRARRRILVIASTTFIVPIVFAQEPAAKGEQDLDVTMRIIVDPQAKVPDEVVHRIPLPKPQPVTPATPPADKGKPEDPGAKGKANSAEAREQGREFGQQTAEQARQRADEAKRNGKPDKPTPPPRPPGNPPGQQ